MTLNVALFTIKSILTHHFHCIMLCKEELHVYFDVLIKCLAVNKCETCLTEILPPSVHKENINYIYTGDN